MNKQIVALMENLKEIKIEVFTYFPYLNLSPNKF